MNLFKIAYYYDTIDRNNHTIVRSELTDPIEVGKRYQEKRPSITIWYCTLMDISEFEEV